MTKYNPSKIESKWQKYWASKKLHLTQDDADGKRNSMLLVEFPYPSGNLHIGHWYAFAIPDILARYKRMNGQNVMYPIGFDAFGLPAENAAIQRGVNPRDWTEENIAYMTKQLQSMGATFDWAREVRTIDPEYYKWTQWMFLKFYEKGLAYRAKTYVNWCPNDKTVLANEQVVGGACDRCGTEVEQKEYTQWLFKITQFADALIDDLESLDWPETTKLAQKNWIGRSEGSIIKFKLDDSRNDAEHNADERGKNIRIDQRTDQRESACISVFTTRADTLFGATYVVLAPEHSIISNLKSYISNLEEVENYIIGAKRKSELERISEVKNKTGVELKGIKAINPINNEKIPIFIADYVLAHYGTGAVMAVPAHDQRDFDFAARNHLPVRKVIASRINADNKNDKLRKAMEEDGYLIDSDEFNGLTSEEARRMIVEELNKIGLGEVQKQYRLHDWIISRQRYWGVPIPLVFCEHCAKLKVKSSKLKVNEEESNSQIIEKNGIKYAIVSVSEKDLPVILPKLDDFKPSDDGSPRLSSGEAGHSPLAKAEKWLKVECPKCGGEAERETDTMDTFVDSSWYFMRYTDPDNNKAFADKEKMNKWLPVPLYIGGAEHNTMHLLYSRFFTKALYSLGYLDFSEPYEGRVNHGIILGPDGQKMSKSRGNVVDPDIEVKNYGADTIRMYLSFMGPYDQGGPWDSKGINGVFRFLNRIWNFVSRYNDKKLGIFDKSEINTEITRAIKSVGDDISELKFNTGVSGLMKMLNSLEELTGENAKLKKEQYELILKIIAPYAPHIAEELWSGTLGNNESIHLQSWPEYDERLLDEEKVNLVIQINGKVRDLIEIKKGLSESEVKELVMVSEKIIKHLSGKQIKKFIYVKDRLTNLVV